MFAPKTISNILQIHFTRKNPIRTKTVKKIFQLFELEQTEWMVRRLASYVLTSKTYSLDTRMMMMFLNAIQFQLILYHIRRMVFRITASIIINSDLMPYFDLVVSFPCFQNSIFLNRRSVISQPLFFFLCTISARLISDSRRISIPLINTKGENIIQSLCLFCAICII